MLKPQVHVRRCSWRDHRNATHQKDDRLQFSIPQLNASKLFVITAEKKVRDECVHRHQEMCTLLGKMADAKPVADPDWLDVDAWKKMRSWILTS